MLNSKHLSLLVNKIGDKTEFTITRVHCTTYMKILFQDGRFRWVRYMTGLDFTNWAPNEPNNLDGCCESDADCLQARPCSFIQPFS